MPRQQAPSVHVPASIPPAHGIELLRKRKAKGEELLRNVHMTQDEYDRWKSMVEDTLEKVFGCPSEKFAIFYAPAQRTGVTHPGDWYSRCKETLREQLAVIETFVELLSEQIELHATIPSSSPDKHARPDLDLFISHSKKDEAVATALIELFRASLNLEPTRIRCTSVPGYKLPTGSSTEEQLRIEVHSASVLVGLITPNSLQSAYVLFELGARWGAKLHLWPVIAGGCDTGALRGPLQGFNAVTCYSQEDLQQLLEDLAKKLGKQLQSPNVYKKQLDTVITVGTPPPAESKLDLLPLIDPNSVPNLPKTAALNLGVLELCAKVKQVPPL